MTEQKNYEGNVGDRLERLPISKFHWKFTLMVTGGEWFITFMLLALGEFLALVSKTLGLSTAVATFVMPTSAFSGMFVGTLLFGRLADKFGRRTIYFFNLMIFATGGILAALMSNYILIAVFMFVLGTGMGAEIPLGDTYISEMMPGNSRGSKLAMVYTVAITSAPVGAFVLLKLTEWNLNLGWRLALVLVCVGALIFQVVRWRIPESPRWLESRNRLSEADELTSKIEREVMKDMKLGSLPQVVRKTPVISKNPKMTELFSSELRRNTLMVLIFQYAQSGVFFGFVALVPTFLVIKGVSLVTTIYFTMLIYLGFVLGSIANMFYIDRVERKYGVVGSIIISGVFGILFAATSNTVLIIIFGFLTAFALWNMSNFFHQYQAEIFPTKLRGSGTGLGQSINAVASATVPLMLVFYALPLGVIPVFIILWILIAIVTVDIMVFGPRTSQRELESIANI